MQDISWKLVLQRMDHGLRRVHRACLSSKNSICRFPTSKSNPRWKLSLSVEGVKLFSAMMEMLRQMQITTETIDKFISLSSKSFRK